MSIRKMTARQRKQLIRACEIVNQDPGVKEIEREFDALVDPIVEPWEPAKNLHRRAPRKTPKDRRT